MERGRRHSWKKREGNGDGKGELDKGKGRVFANYHCYHSLTRQQL